VAKYSRGNFMTTHKRVDGDYVITTTESGDFVTVNTHTLEVNGNLNVRGNLTYIEVSELRVDDPFITVAANNSGSGAGAAFPNQGLVAQTGSSTFAGLRFHNDTAEWQISNSVDADGDPILAYQPIGVATAGLPGAPVDSLQFNAGSDTFGGSANLLYHAANSEIALQGHLSLGSTVPVPAITADAVNIFGGPEGSGATGVYVRSATVNDELVSRSAAIVFAIIF
jgi:hypothetical protein